jgi:hypothetical protein
MLNSGTVKGESVLLLLLLLQKKCDRKPRTKKISRYCYYCYCYGKIQTLLLLQLLLLRTGRLHYYLVAFLKCCR